MILSNHILTGAVIATALNQPLLALPVAFASHFALDSLPHFGYQDGKGLGWLLHKKFAYLVLAFELVALVVLAVTLKSQPLSVYITALAAASPDSVMFFHYFCFELRGKPNPPIGPITRFHRRIQWGERPWGFAIEIGYFFGMLILLKKII